MSNLITAKIDVRKLDKARFFEGKPDKDGHRPLYADIVLMPKKEVGKFGDTHFVVQSKKKEEQIQMPIIGSATERGGEKREQASPGQPRPAATTQDNLDSDVPF